MRRSQWTRWGCSEPGCGWGWDWWTPTLKVFLKQNKWGISRLRVWFLYSLKENYTENPISAHFDGLSKKIPALFFLLQYDRIYLKSTLNVNIIFGSKNTIFLKGLVLDLWMWLEFVWETEMRMQYPELRTDQAPGPGPHIISFHHPILNTTPALLTILLSKLSRKSTNSSTSHLSYWNPNTKL